MQRVIDIFSGESDSARKCLSAFLRTDGSDYQFVSLGENCSSAWYLKQAGLRNCAYPFDWIFSSPDIVLDCIKDGFSKFLDRRMIVPKKGNSAAGHQYYHVNFFNHRNPLRSREDYDYYHRCCQRFLRLTKSKDNILYVIILINEPDRRPGWANGFSEYFPMPQNQNLKTVQELVIYLKDCNDNSQFLVIDHYTNCDRRVIAQKMDDSIFYMRFFAGGSNTGVYYTEYIDDFCFKHIIAGLNQSTCRNQHHKQIWALHPFD